jgi:hypothetical protein
MIIVWIVLEVGVLDQDPWLDRALKCGADGGTLAVIGFMAEHEHPRILTGGRPEQALGVVGGAIIDDDQLVYLRLAEDALDDLADGAGFIEDGDDDGELDGFRRPGVNQTFRDE